MVSQTDEVQTQKPQKVKFQVFTRTCPLLFRHTSTRQMLVKSCTSCKTATTPTPQNRPQKFPNILSKLQVHTIKHFPIIKQTENFVMSITLAGYVG